LWENGIASQKLGTIKTKKITLKQHILQRGVVYWG
jgi:hypothetical protein